MPLFMYIKPQSMSSWEPQLQGNLDTFMYIGDQFHQEYITKNNF